MTTDEQIHIVHEREQQRYDIFVGSTRGGYAEYTLDDGVMTFTHTITNPSMRGQGLAGKVVKQALDDARSDGLHVVPQCWFVAQFIDEHPEYRDVLAS